MSMYAAGLGQDARTTLLTAAALAPSMHNTQPWRFEVGPTSVRVYRDLERWLRVGDPNKSALYMSLGAAVLNLRVAAAELGRLPHVAMLPDPNVPDLVARLELATGLGADAELATLFPYLARRRTSRMPFSDRRIPDSVVRELTRAARCEGALLRLERDPGRVRRLLGLAAEGSTDELFDLEALVERAHWVGGDRAADGVPAYALGPVPVDRSAVVRDLAVRQVDRERATARFERHPVLAVLSVRRDDKLGWLNAGQALQRVLLSAARSGLSASFMSQALSSGEHRWLVHEPSDGQMYPQMLMRLGYGRLPDPTPRRPLEDLEPAAGSFTDGGRA